MAIFWDAPQPMTVCLLAAHMSAILDLAVDMR
jgi:hypothetical protein